MAWLLAVDEGDSDDNAGEPVASFSVNEEREGGFSDPAESSESSLVMSEAFTMTSSAMQAFLAWLLAMGDGDGDGEYEELVPSFSVYEEMDGGWSG